MKANLELAFDVKIRDEEVVHTIKLVNVEMSTEFFEDFCALNNGKSCKVTMSLSEK